MNKFLKEQIDELFGIDLEYIDSNHFIIHNSKEPYIQYELNHSYLIELADYILHPFENYTLHTNWNNGIIPTSKYMNVCIMQKMGKMNKVDCIGVDKIGDECYNTNNETYMGLWLPEGGMKKIKEI